MQRTGIPTLPRKMVTSSRLSDLLLLLREGSVSFRFVAAAHQIRLETLAKPLKGRF